MFREVIRVLVLNDIYYTVVSTDQTSKASSNAAAKVTSVKVASSTKGNQLDGDDSSEDDLEIITDYQGQPIIFCASDETTSRSSQKVSMVCAELQIVHAPFFRLSVAEVNTAKLAENITPREANAARDKALSSNEEALKAVLECKAGSDRFQVKVASLTLSGNNPMHVVRLKNINLPHWYGIH